MLKQLYIKNFTLIDELDMSFYPGFSVITGETGAGKSIILGAIAILLGQRNDGKSIKSGTEKCTIEAHFDLQNYNLQVFFNENDIDYIADDCILRRELTASGKSRSFINDTPVPLTLMRQLGQQLVDVHSQHKNLLLQKEDFQLNVVDIMAANQELLFDYQRSFNYFSDCQKELEELKKAHQLAQENEDYLRFLYDELHDAQLQEGQQTELEKEAEMMNHSEDIKSSLFEADHLLNDEDNGIISKMKTSSRAIDSIRTIFPDISETSNRLDSCFIEIQDIAHDIDKLMQQVDFDPQRQNDVQFMLDRIYSLEKKHHVNTIEELITIRDNLEKQLSHIKNGDEEIEEMSKKVHLALEECKKKASELSESRHQATKKIEEELTKRLVPLGIPNVRFNVDIQPKDLSKDGADKVCFYFSANKNTPLLPISEVASGGEVSRVMLSLKAMISGSIKLPTIIFDEIDTGVSGKIAEKMALIMDEMGKNKRQVISITHLPQIAALGTTHYKVFKEETSSQTVSTMKKLSREERVQEIAQMLSGSEVTDAAVSNARVLLKM